MLIRQTNGYSTMIAFRRHKGDGNCCFQFAHAANADGKAAMASLQANDQIPDRAKALAGIIGNMNHTASADAKATLGELFP
jgi:hypothetical protein